MPDRPGGHLAARRRRETVAELTSRQDGVVRQQVIEQLMRRIMHYDTEFRREEATSEVGSKAKH